MSPVMSVEPTVVVSRRRMLTAVAVVGGVGVAGCDMLKAKPAPTTSFVAAEPMYHDPALPFQRVWRRPDLNWDKYRKLYVAPVDTNHMLRMTEWQEGVRRAEIESDVRNLAVYTQNALKKAFREDPKRRLRVLETTDAAADTLSLEVALIEVVPSKVVLNMLQHVPWGVGLGISAVRGIAGDKSTVAIEARLRDASSGLILAAMADREAQVIAPGNLRGLTWYGHAHQIINNWADQFVKVVNRDRAAGQVVDDTRPFTLRPW